MPESTQQEQRFIIDLEPVGRRAEIIPGMTLLEAAQSAGVELVSLCGGAGLCDGCRVRLVEGRLSAPNQVERDALSSKDLAAGFRLACQAIPEGDVKIDIPPESLTTPQRLQVEGEQRLFPVKPAIHAVDLNLNHPSLQDLRSDASRLKEALLGEAVAAPRFSYPVLTDLSDRLRELDWKLRLAMRGDQIVAILAQDQPLVGLAVDVGTTKLAAYLVKLADGETLAKGGAMNPQIAYGEDVVSRIAYANSHEDGRDILQRALIDRLNDLVESLCTQAGVTPGQIVDAVVVGNTVMHHFFAGLPVRQLGAAPYVPTVSEALAIRAVDLGLAIAPGASVHLPPNIAGYVGADHAAMVLATRVWEAGRVQLALDIGTNTEISLSVNGQLYSCSCASGPAFEGAHIRDGMRAAPGAIERVQFIDGAFNVQTIGGEPAVGICGSGILDAVAQMVQQGVIDTRGALQEGHPLVRRTEGKAAFLLSQAKDNGHGRDVVVTRNDINEIQLAKSAIRAGIEILLQEAGIEAHALESFIVAGAFGSYIDIGSAIEVGMFPALPLDRFQQVGNAAGMGAQELLVSASQRQRLDAILERMQYVELTTHPDFQNVFIRHLYF